MHFELLLWEISRSILTNIYNIISSGSPDNRRPPVTETAKWEKDLAEKQD